jgi:hypothetical protein
MSNESNELIAPFAIISALKRTRLLATESRDDFEAFFNSVAHDDVLPRTYLEWHWTLNYCRAAHAADRYRNAIADIINATRHDALRTILEAILPEGEDRLDLAALLAADWFERPSERATVRALLAKHDLDDETISGQALALRAADVETVGRMALQNELAAREYMDEIICSRRASSRVSSGELVVANNRKQLSPPSADLPVNDQTMALNASQLDADVHVPPSAIEVPVPAPPVSVHAPAPAIEDDIPLAPAAVQSLGPTVP